MITVAVLDDGVSTRHPDLVKSVEVTDDLQIAAYDMQEEIESHGTVCYRIIKKYAPSCQVFSVKILDGRSRRCHVSKLIAGLHWCLQQGIPVVHLSLGSIEYEDFLPIRRSVSELISKGIFVVAACHNRNIVTCPASLFHVIGVKADPSLQDGEFYFNQTGLDGIDFSASSRHLLKTENEKNPIFLSPLANSFAAPVVTAAVCRLLEDQPAKNRQDLMARLCQISKRTDANYQVPYYRPNGILEKALVINIRTQEGESAKAESLQSLPLLFDAVQLDWAPKQWSNDGFCRAQLENYHRTNPALVLNICGPAFSAALAESIKGWLTQRKGKPTLFFAQHHRGLWRGILDRYEDVILMGTQKSDGLQTDLPAVAVPVVVLEGFPPNRLFDALFQLRALFFQEHIRALMVTDCCQGMAMGFEYLPETLPSAYSLRQLSSTFQSAILVVGISSRKDGEEGLEDVDICVRPHPGPGIQAAQVYLEHDLRDIPGFYRTLMKYLEDS